MSSSTELSPQQRLDLIKQNLAEILNPEIIEDVVLKQNRPLEIYWGTATTGRPHCGYFVPILKVAEFLKAQCKVKILLADIHGFLDNLKAPLELVGHRAKYYQFVITALLEAVQVPTDKLEFVLGSSYQLTPEYTMDLFKLCSVVTEHDAKKAGAEVVKQVDNATLSSLIYPLMQTLDEEFLKVDAQFGGVDQRKIFTLAKDVLPRIGYKERAHMMNAMVPGLQGGKMSASDPDSKIDLLDPPEVVTKKLKKAYGPPQIVEDNGLIKFIETVLLPAGILKYGEPKFVVERREGEPLVYTSSAKVEEDYKADILTPQLIKPAITTALNELLAPIQAAFQASEEWQKIEKLAYPPPVAVKKEKKKKDKGSRYPGGGAPAKDVVAQPDGSVEGAQKDEVSLGGSAADVAEGLKKVDI